MKKIIFDISGSNLFHFLLLMQPLFIIIVIALLDACPLALALEIAQQPENFLNNVAIDQPNHDSGNNSSTNSKVADASNSNEKEESSSTSAIEAGTIIISILLLIKVFKILGML